MLGKLFEKRAVTHFIVEEEHGDACFRVAVHGLQHVELRL